MVTIKTIRIMIVIGLLALVGVLAPAQVALAAPDQGSIEWGKDRTYWPNESEARYWIAYPTVDITDIRPGASNEFRLTIGNLTDEPLTVDIAVVTLEEAEIVAAESKTLPDRWVRFTEESSEDSTKVSAAELHTIPANSSKDIWCHVDVPKDKDLLDDKFQCAIQVIDYSEGIAAEEGVECVVSVSTADDLSGTGQKSIVWIFFVIAIVIVVVFGVLYLIARSMWPNEPAPEKEFKTGLHPGDWQG